MGRYFIANIAINDEQAYAEYLKRCDEIFSKYRGTYVAVDDAPLVLEGRWDYTKVVVVRFDSEADFFAWYQSPEYEEIRCFRLAGARCDSILVRDKEPEITVERIAPGAEEFQELIDLLDHSLRERYPDPQGFYAAKNRLAPDTLGVLLRFDRAPVACGAIRPFSEGVFEVKRMFVRPEFRGRGLSRRVLDELERLARGMGGHRLILETGTRQTEALGLYRSSGFAPIPNYGEYAGITTSVCMEKSI